MEEIGLRDSSTTRLSPPYDIKEMIKSTSQASWELAEPIGEGTEYRAEFDKGNHASALTFEDSLVHGSVLVAV